MPYISIQQRSKFDDWLKELGNRIGSAGELNYCISVLCKMYAQHGGEPNYQKHNEIIGVLECAKLENYRRKVACYEDKKCNENGDI